VFMATREPLSQRTTFLDLANEHPQENSCLRLKTGCVRIADARWGGRACAVCVRVCVRTCVRACVCVCVELHVRVCVFCTPYFFPLLSWRSSTPEEARWEPRTCRLLEPYMHGCLAHPSVHSAERIAPAGRHTASPCCARMHTRSHTRTCACMHAVVRSSSQFCACHPCRQAG